VAAIIRRATAEDVPGMAAIDREATDFPWTPAQFADSLGHHHTLVLEAAEVLSGFLVYSRVLDEAELLNVAVSPSAQGRGYGALLVEHFIDLNRGAAVRLLLEVRASNRRATDLYQRHGFTRQGVRKGYYPARQGREDAWIMAYEY
jgi:ribosomal-protein-alanine N-acetyltransferase